MPKYLFRKHLIYVNFINICFHYYVSTRSVKKFKGKPKIYCLVSCLFHSLITGVASKKTYTLRNNLIKYCQIKQVTSKLLVFYKNAKYFNTFQ